MAKNGGGGSGSNRGMFEIFAFLIATGIVGVEMHLLFREWWPLFGLWYDRNFLAPSLLILGLLMGPVAALMAVKGMGKRVGDEAEDIGRRLDQ